MGGTMAESAAPDRWDYWDGSPLPDSPVLRWGFTTGACAAAVLTASFLSLARGDQDGAMPASVSLLFNDGKVRTLPLGPALPERPGYMVIRKNGGDDPDSTHGALIYGRVTRLARGDALSPGPEDYLLAAGRARLCLRCVEGVGRATRDGLDCLAGHWAVNAGVRSMIAANLARCGMDNGSYLAEIGVAGGAALARRTLNPTLGIEGGISLLGTTGLVRPYSNEAYVATIRVCARANARAGCRTFVLCTGGRTEKGARAWAAGEGLAVTGPLPDTAFTAIADFVGPAIRAAARCGTRRVIVCCMPGKLLKYSRGLDNTHAHRNAQDMPALAELVRGLAPGETALAEAAGHAATVREALDPLPASLRTAVLDALARRALALFPERLDRATPPERAPGFAILLTDAAGRRAGWYADDRFLAQPPEADGAGGGNGTKETA